VLNTDSVAPFASTNKAKTRSFERRVFQLQILLFHATNLSHCGVSALPRPSSVHWIQLKTPKWGHFVYRRLSSDGGPFLYTAGFPRTVGGPSILPAFLGRGQFVYRQPSSAVGHIYIPSAFLGGWCCLGLSIPHAAFFC
jgi:hypothetical protein